MQVNQRPSSPLKAFGFSSLLTVIALGLVFATLGSAAAAVTAVLVIVEVVFSFDNAILNAKVLGTLSPFWQRIFLSVGVVIAVLGMRVIFPVVIVATTAHLPWQHVLNLALHHPTEYAARLAAAHTAIAAFGGAFLMLLALDFFLDDDRTVLWLVRIERFFQRVARRWVPFLVTVGALCLVAIVPANHQPGKTFSAGCAGIVTYLVVQLVTQLFSGTQKHTAAPRVGMAAFVTFLYLELLDASFSFDGVLGAFAITNKVILIAVGLGIGALWVRSLSVFMVRRGTLNAYRFLIHGAHYTILLLSLLLLAGIVVEIPDATAGLIGLGCIAASIIASKKAISDDKRTAHLKQ